MTRLKRSRIKYTPGLCGTSCTFLVRSGFSFLANVPLLLRRIMKSFKERRLKPPSSAAINRRSLRRFALAATIRPCSTWRSWAAGRPDRAARHFARSAGLRTLLLEREVFPREKVCGDCLNPACWPILRRLELAERVRSLPHGVLDRVEFIGIGGRTLAVTLPAGDDAEIAVKRSLFDQLIMTRARELGATICEGSTVTALTAPGAATRGIGRSRRRAATFEARVLVAADGRNSTIARLCHLLPRGTRERIALQTHLPLPHDFGNRVVLQFRPEGYSGQAPVGAGELNLCLVSVPRKMAALRPGRKRASEFRPSIPGARSRR